MKKLKANRAYASRHMAPPVRPAVDMIWAVVGAELPSPKGNILIFTDFCPFFEREGENFGWEELASVEPTRRIFTNFLESVASRLVGGLRLMGFYVETSKPFDSQLPFVRTNTHSQLQLIESPTTCLGSEFFLWVKTGADIRLLGAKMTNGSGIYKPPKFIEAYDLLQFHHLFFRDTLAVPVPIGSTIGEFLSEKANCQHLLEGLARQFRTKLARGVFVFGQQIGSAATPLPEIESSVFPLVQDSVEDLESDALGNVSCVRLKLDLCALVLKETSLADNIGAFVDDFHRTLSIRLPPAIPQGPPAHPSPAQEPQGSPSLTCRFYLTKYWTRLSVYPTVPELHQKQALRHRFHEAFSTVKTIPSETYVVSSNEI